MGMAWIKPARLRQLGMLGMNCRNVEFINRYNDRRLYPLVDNKLKTKLLAQEWDVPTPRLQFVVREQHEISHIERELADLESMLSAVVVPDTNILELRAEGRNRTELAPLIDAWNDAFLASQAHVRKVASQTANEALKQELR